MQCAVGSDAHNRGSHDSLGFDDDFFSSVYPNYLATWCDPPTPRDY